MLNPSNCRRLRRRPDDPSVRQLRPGPRREACGILEVVNLFAYRVTDPAARCQAADPVSPANDHFIE